MGYIDKDLKIKTVKGIEKYLKNKFSKNFIVLKTQSYVKIIWCANNELQFVDLKASVIYVIKTEDFNQVVETINKSFKDEEKLN